VLQIEQESQANVCRALNIIKCGLFSKDLEVVVECSRTINKLWDELRDTQVYVIQQIMYDWFTFRPGHQNISNF